VNARAAAAAARADAAVALLALLAMVAWEWAGADLPLSRHFAGAAGFDARQSWWAAGLLHDGGRLLAWALLSVLAWRCWRAPAQGPTRTERMQALAATLACLLAVPLLKVFSDTSCPWDLAEFGGVAQYVPHWVPGLKDGGPGHCFPSGHAVAAFGFFPMYFLWRRHDAARARAWLAGVLIAGFVFGLAQLVRGAHFASHTMWSAWLCWVISALAAFGVRAPVVLATQAVQAALTPMPVPVAARPDRRTDDRPAAGR
jgi:membrane-associated PAP2 superfamily phosphatase